MDSSDESDSNNESSSDDSSLESEGLDHLALDDEENLQTESYSGLKGNG